MLWCVTSSKVQTGLNGAGKAWRDDDGLRVGGGVDDGKKGYNYNII